jgi:hypothetical protein
MLDLCSTAASLQSYRAAADDFFLFYQSSGTISGFLLIAFGSLGAGLDKISKYSLAGLGAGKGRLGPFNPAKQYARLWY